MYGGGPGRTNATTSPVLPPLSLAWSYDASSGFSPYSGALADSMLFIQNLQGEIRIVNATDGHELSSHRLGASAFGTPVLQNDTMYVAMSRDPAGLFAYTLNTATMRWKLNAGDIETSPLLIQDRLYATTYDGRLICVNTSSGLLLWTFRAPEVSQPAVIRSSPAGDDSTVVFGCDDHKLYAVNAASGTLRWSAATRGSIVASPSVADRKVLVGSLDSSFYAFGLDSGDLVWQQPLGSRIFGSQAVARGRVYAGTSGGDVFCLDMLDGSVIWKSSLKSIVSTTPMVSDTVVYVGCGDKKIYALSGSSGSILWSGDLQGRARGTPLAWNGFLVVLDDTHTVSAFREGGR